MLKLAMKKSCCVKKTSFIDLEDLHELKTGFALDQNVNLVLTSFSYSSCGMRDQANSTHNTFYEENIEDDARFMSNVIASRAHGHSCHSELMCCP